MARLLLILTLLIASLPAAAQQADAPIQQLLQEHAGQLAKPSRTKVAPTIDAIAGSGLPEAQTVLRKWQDKELWRNTETGLFIWAEEIDRDTIRGFDFAGDTPLGELPDDAFEQSKPNSGVRKMIGAALVKFQLTAEDLATRRTAINNIERDAEASHLAPCARRSRPRQVRPSRPAPNASNAF